MENPERKLTAKQEKFAECIAGGMTQADAYRTAYNAGNMKDISLWPKASELMKNGKVKARVKELKEKLENKQLWTREMSVQGLIEAIAIAKDKGNSAAVAGAIKELNAMHGFNAPKQVELSGGLQIQKIERVIVKP